MHKLAMSLNESMNEEGVCRRAPATLGLLKNVSFMEAAGICGRKKKLYIIVGFYPHSRFSSNIQLYNFLYYLNDGLRIC